MSKKSRPRHTSKRSPWSIHMAGELSRDQQEWPREEQVKWCRQRAMVLPWRERPGSMINDMNQMGIPLTYQQARGGTALAEVGTEAEVNEWIAGIE